MRILVACEYSGRVREAFRAKGHDAYSCDILPADDGSPYHFQDDILEIIDGHWELDEGPTKWDMMIAHPPCTYLCSSGLHWNKKRPERAKQTEDAIRFAMALWHAPIPLIAMENPIGCLSTHLGKPAQYIQPYEFGEDASKRTCLWLKGLPRLKPTRYIEPRIIDGKKRWANQTDSGQNKLGPSEDRAKIRSLTYQGWADAFADQWG